MRRLLKSVLAVALSAAAFAPQLQAQVSSGIYVAGPGDIWLAGTGSSLVHGRSGSWVQATGANLPTLHAVAGFGPNDVWIVGDEGLILHWNGSSLSRPWGGSEANLVAIYGCAANDIWVVGQSEDESQPAVLLHYNGSSWTVQRITPAFRPSGIAGVCVTGGGGGDLVVAGISFFDPRPDQRRNVGVVSRLRGGSWTSSGWDGRRMNDEQLGGTAWTGVAAGGGTVVIYGERVALMSVRGGPWTPLAGFPGAAGMLVMPDGTPIALNPNGFSRYLGGQWHTVGQGAMDNSANMAMANTARGIAASQQAQAARGDTAAVRRITARMEAISHNIPDGGMPTAAQMTEIMQLQQQLMAANGGQMPGMMSMQQAQQLSAQGQAAQAENQRNQAAGMRNRGLAFGEHPAGFAAGGADFYVAGDGGVMHITGDASKVVFSAMCISPALQQMPANMSADCRADGGTGGPPPALVVPLAAPHVEGPSITAPTRGNPLPSIRKPRIRIP